jgi:2-oxoisovalerate dehydrogenase E1 component
MRCASLDTPVPFSTVLEQQFLAKSRLEETIAKLVSF